MNSYLRQLVTKILCLVFGALMLASFFAFVTIPYSLGGHPGDENSAWTPLQAPTEIAVSERQDTAQQNAPLAVRL